MDDSGGIGKRIRAKRRALNLTQAQLAELVGVRTITVSDWERGKYEPYTGRIDKLAEVLHTTAGYLLDAPEAMLSEQDAAELEQMYGSAPGTLAQYTKPYTAEQALEAQQERKVFELENRLADSYANMIRSYLRGMNTAGREELCKRAYEMFRLPEYQLPGYHGEPDKEQEE